MPARPAHTMQKKRKKKKISPTFFDTRYAVLYRPRSLTGGRWGGGGSGGWDGGRKWIIFTLGKESETVNVQKARRGPAEHIPLGAGKNNTYESNGKTRSLVISLEVKRNNTWTRDRVKCNICVYLFIYLSIHSFTQINDLAAISNT